MSGRAETLATRIDHALAEVSAIEASLRVRRAAGSRQAIDRGDLGRRFRAIAHAGRDITPLRRCEELAALAEKVTDGADRSVLHSEQGDRGRAARG